MAEQHFTLNERLLDQQIEEPIAAIGLDQLEVDEQVPINIELFVVKWTDDWRLHSVPKAVELAWLAYLLSSRGLWDGPEGFGGHAIIGHGVAGGPSGGEDYLILEVRHDVGPAVLVGPLDAEEIYGPMPQTMADGPRSIQRAARLIVEQANTVVEASIRASEAPSAGPQTLVLDQAAIDRLKPVPILNDEPESIDLSTVADQLLDGPVVISAPGHPHWCIQAIGSGDHVHIEILNPLHWESGPALPAHHLKVAAKLGFTATEAAWVCEVPAEDQAGLENAAALIRSFIEQAWPQE